MSAIFGILRFDGQAASAAEVERMGATMPYRSPDRRKIEMLGPVGLGHGLMRVTHEDWNDAQPLRDTAADLTLVADVRLDNREELADALGIGAEALGKMADSALILAAYKRWGEDLVEHLLGDFAFAIWDGAARKLVLVRDHMGLRPLFYTRQDGFFAFASEMKALWAVEGVPRRISELAIASRLLRWPLPAGATQYEEILAFTGSSLTTLTADGQFRSRRYWRPKADPKHEGRDEAYYVATYRQVLAEAVACRLRRNLKPTALLISGGYDSTAIAGLAGEVMRSQGRKLIGISAVLPEGKEDVLGNARRWVDICARHMPHLDIRYFVRGTSTALTGLERDHLATDQFGPTSRHMLAGLYDCATAAGARVIMDGMGGDYTLNHRGDGSLAYLLRRGAVVEFFRSAVGEARWKRASLRSVMINALRQAAPRWLAALKNRLSGGGQPAWQDAPINDDFARRMSAQMASNDGARDNTPREHWRMRRNILDILNGLTDTSATARATLLYGRELEMVRPFHDKRVIEFALAIPEALYAMGGRNRYLAHQALADILPPEFATRPWGGNDQMDPDTEDMLDSIEAELDAEVTAMSSDNTLSRYIDFEWIRLNLADRRPRSTQKRLNALKGVLTAHHLRWLNQQNISD